MSGRYVLSIWIESSIQMLLRITMPSGLCQPNCSGAIVGHTCIGCGARIAGCRWFRHQQMEKEQAKKVQCTTCAGERWALGIAIACDDWYQLTADVAHNYP